MKVKLPKTAGPTASTENPGLVGVSQHMADVRESIATYAPSDEAVLITGETGVGKELVAEALHKLSARTDSTYLKINCNMMSGETLRSELFGHEKGAFSGAHQPKTGIFQKANNGTVFLDEIGDVSLETQGHLLRALENREGMKVGGTEEYKIEGRFIAATDKPASESFNLRPQLLYRFVHRIHIVPLRYRLVDIVPIFMHFLTESRPPTMPKTLPLRVVYELLTYEWPGNVRELKNAVSSYLLSFARWEKNRKMYSPQLGLIPGSDILRLDYPPEWRQHGLEAGPDVWFITGEVPVKDLERWNRGFQGYPIDRDSWEENLIRFLSQFAKAAEKRFRGLIRKARRNTLAKAVGKSCWESSRTILPYLVDATAQRRKTAAPRSQGREPANSHSESTETRMMDLPASVDNEAADGHRVTTCLPGRQISLSLDLPLDSAIASFVQSVYAKNRHNKSKTARILRVSSARITRWLVKHNQTSKM